ncbi:MAG: hypothetical protein KGL39_29535 [Patescibacteria group bacterium]|nr:hypothetical protein [Patescibacteria group bacterium]
MRGTKSNNRALQIKIRLNQRERQAFDGAAAVAGLTLSAWVRMVLRERVAERLGDTA